LQTTYFELDISY